MKHLSKLIKDAKTLLNYIEEEVAVIPLMNRLTRSQEELDTANRLYHPYETMLREMLDTYSKRHKVWLGLNIESGLNSNCVTICYRRLLDNYYISILKEQRYYNGTIEYCCQKLLQAISHEGLDYYIKKKLRDLNINK